MKKSTTLAAQPTTKTAEKKHGNRLPIEEFIARINDRNAEEDNDGEGVEELGKIAQILKCYAKGYSKKEIVKAGFNRSTVYRQCKEFDILKKGPVKNFHGFEMYEARILRVMRTKDMNREEAAEWIAAKDEVSDTE